MGAIHPLDDLRVVAVRHEERESEVVKQALGGTFPFGFFGANLKEFAGKGHVFGRKIEGLTKRFADGNLLGRNIAAASLEAVDFSGNGGEFVLQFSHGDGIVGDAVFQVGLVGCADRLESGDAVVLGVESCGIAGGGFVEFGNEIGVAVGLGFTAVALTRKLADAGGQGGDAVAAVLGDLTVEVGFVAAKRSKGFRDPLNTGSLALMLGVEGGGAFFQQLQLERGKVRFQKLAGGAQFLDFRAEFLMPVTIGDDGFQQQNLAFGADDGGVSAVEIVEMGDESGDTRFDIEGFEHVAADEISEISHGFHRNRLVEQIERLLGLDSEAAAEPRAVIRESVEGLSVVLAEPAAKFGDVRIEVGEIGDDRERLLRADVEAGRLAGGVFHPEHAGKGDGLVEAAVVEDGENDRERVSIAQADRFGGTDATFRAFRAMVAEDVGAQAAFLEFRTSGLVVGDAVGGDEQRGDRIDEGGFPRANISC